KEIRDRCLSLARKAKLKDELMDNIMKKCLEASERRSGLSLVIQMVDPLLPRCHPGYHDVSTEPDAFGLRKRRIGEIPDKEYLNAVAGDNSVIVSQDGHTLAYHAALAPRETTEVKPIAGTGSRHLSAQKLTK